MGTYAFIMGQNVLNKNFKNFDHLMIIGVFPEENCIEHPGASGWFIYDERLNRLSKRTDIKIYGFISVPLKSGQININQTIPEKGKN